MSYRSVYEIGWKSGIVSGSIGVGIVIVCNACHSFRGEKDMTVNIDITTVSLAENTL